MENSLQNSVKELLLTAISLEKSKKIKMLQALPKMNVASLQALQMRLLELKSRDEKLVKGLPPEILIKLKHEINSIHFKNLSAFDDRKQKKEAQLADTLLSDALASM
ncbi:MAG: hypothetical protein V1936_04240 [Patescibacteria group bacterium]